MNALARFRERLAVGVVLTCDQNTHTPTKEGSTRTLTRVGLSYAYYIDGKGVPWEMGLPTRVRQIEWLDDDTVRWRLDNLGQLAHDGEHTVIWRFTGLDGGRPPVNVAHVVEPAGGRS